jgi:hemoglobin
MTNVNDDERGVTLYEYVGGTPFFERLVDAFYAGVAADPVLRPMYPDDLAGPKARLTGFLVQYWGGPTDYSDARGHPRLRLRHAPFVVDQRARDAWLAHMTAAVAASGADDAVATALLDYFAPAATAMINTRDAAM